MVIKFYITCGLLQIGVNMLEDKEGISNHEHFIDIFKEIDILRENLSDNTDTAFEILKMYQDDKDQDSIDVLRITCSNILDCEELSKQVIDRYETLKANLFANKQAKVEEKEAIAILEELKKLEKSSSKQFKELLKLVSSLK